MSSNDNKIIAINDLGNEAKNLIFLGVLTGKLTLAPPHILLDSFFFGQTQVFGFSGVKSKTL